MRVFISGGNPSMPLADLVRVLDAAHAKRGLVLIAYSAVCPVTTLIEQWARGTSILYGSLTTQAQEAFWDLVDSVIALPGTPEALLVSAKQYNKPVWEPFKPKAEPG